MPAATENVTAIGFGLEIQGVAAAYFQSISGLGITIDPIEIRARDKTGKELLQQQPGNVHYSPVTCTRGLVADKSLWEWIKQVANGEWASAKKNCSLITYDESFKPVQRFNLANAWPSSFTIGDVSAENAAPAMETLTLTYDYFEIA